MEQLRKTKVYPESEDCTQWKLALFSQRKAESPIQYDGPTAKRGLEGKR